MLIAPDKQRYNSLSDRELRGPIFFSAPDVPRFHDGMLFIRKIIKKFDPNVIIASSPPPECAFQTLLIAKITETPFIFDARDLYGPVHLSQNKKWKTKIDFHLERICYRFSDFIFTTTDLQRFFTAKIYGVPLSKIKVVPNGADLERFKGLKVDKEWDLIYSGSLPPERRPQLMVSFLEKIVKQKEDVKICFLGTCTDSPMIKMLAKNNPSNVILLKEVQIKEVPVYLSRAKIGLLTISDNHWLSYAIPAKVFEYCAAGLPVLCIGPSFCNETRKIFEKYQIGYYSSGLSTAIQNFFTLQDETIYRKFSKNGALFVKEYDRKRIVRDLTDFLKMLIGGAE